MKVDVWLDERGRRCPLPVIALLKASQAYSAGEVIAVMSDDPAAAFDIPAWCRLKGASYVGDIEPPDGGGGRAYVVGLPRPTPPLA
ncbi:MAG: preprotein translocase subunit TatB [Actinobacteria bacterium]|uniref:Unannotated protein n=1 Tax=freshwater metagenome TaxID=449393 RepID=A0A6J7D546_9ZZZZ|nr:preprotein translocase subunit TatB [Actinomycetota bacterium]